LTALPLLSQKDPQIAMAAATQRNFLLPLTNPDSKLSQYDFHLVSGNDDDSPRATTRSDHESFNDHSPRLARNMTRSDL
jgi:hypothetical protein